MTTWRGHATIGWAILWTAGLAMGLVALWFAALEPAFSFMARSPLTAMVGLGAGWTLIAVGLVSWRRQPGNGAGPLLAAAGFAWFVVEWANPASGSSTAFTARPGPVCCLPTVGLPRRPVLPSRTARIR